MFRRKKLLQAEQEPIKQYIVTVDLYSKGRTLRAGIDIVNGDDPIYLESQWAFKEVE